MALPGVLSHIEICNNDASLHMASPMCSSPLEKSGEAAERAAGQHRRCANASAVARSWRHVFLNHFLCLIIKCCDYHCSFCMRPVPAVAALLILAFVCLGLAAYSVLPRQPFDDVKLESAGDLILEAQHMKVSVQSVSREMAVMMH